MDKLTKYKIETLIVVAEAIEKVLQDQKEISEDKVIELEIERSLEEKANIINQPL